MGKYRIEYKLTKRFGNWMHSYSVVGQCGGVNLHLTDYGESRDRAIFEPRYSGGIEIHRRKPYPGDDSPPSQERCWMFELGSPCWHDGSSLQVVERWAPMFERMPNDHEGMLNALCAYADSAFADDDAEPIAEREG